MKRGNVVIVDVSGYRGSDEEQILLGIKDIITKEKEKGIKIQSKHQELLFGVIKALLNSSKGFMDLILYFQSEWRGYIDIQSLVEMYFSEYEVSGGNSLLKEDKDRITLLVGSQSLFYYLGWKSRNIKHVLWFTKEKALFSRNFYNIMKSTRHEILIETYSPLNLQKAIQIIILTPYCFIFRINFCLYNF